MTDDVEQLLAEADRLDTGATPGPWGTDGENIGSGWERYAFHAVCEIKIAVMFDDYDAAAWDEEAGAVDELLANQMRCADAEFIARSRTLVPELAFALRESQAENQRLRAQVYARKGTWHVRHADGTEESILLEHGNLVEDAKGTAGQFILDDTENEQLHEELAAATRLLYRINDVPSDAVPADLRSGIDAFKHAHHQRRLQRARAQGITTGVSGDAS